MKHDKIVIGDIHGCFLTFKALVEKVRKEYPDTDICLCGDLVDRGPRSREVVQYVIDEGFECVQGNHENMMWKDILNEEEGPFRNNWRESQGAECLKSYENHPAQLVSHSIWMNNLPYYLQYDDLVISHSCVFECWPSRYDQDKTAFQDNIIWNRDLPLETLGENFGIFNVFGHTPQSGGPRIESTYANIDTGAVFKRPHYGKLTAIHYPSLEVIQQENID